MRTFTTRAEIADALQRQIHREAAGNITVFAAQRSIARITLHGLLAGTRRLFDDTRQKLGWHLACPDEGNAIARAARSGKRKAPAVSTRKGKS